MERRLTVLDKIRFGKVEAVFIIVNAMSIQLFLGFARRMAESGGTAGWMIPIYTAILALVLFFFISKLYSSFEGKDIIDVAEIAGGSFGRILVGLIFIMDYIFILPIMLRIFGEDIKIFALNQSPLSFVIILFIAVMVIASYSGVESIVRLNVLIMPIVIIGFLIVVFGNYQYFDTTNLLPIFGDGLYKVFVKEISRMSIYSAFSFIFFMVPFIGKNKEFKSIGYWSLIITGIVLTIGTLVYFIVVPYPTSTENFIPYLHLARYVNLGRFFQRVESIFVLVWTMSALIYLSAGQFFLLYMIKKTFRLEYYKPLILPIAIILFTLCFIPQSLMATVTVEGEIIRRFAWIVTFAVPIVVLLVAKLVKRKKEGGKCNEKI